MADNYTLFSEVVPDLTRREQAWVRHVLSDANRARSEINAVGVRLELDEDDELWPGFQWEIQKPPYKDLWVYCEGHGNVQYAVHFVRAFLAKFRPGDCWQMTWVHTYSTPRVGEFGGGGAFVTARSIQFFDPHHMLAREAAAFEKGLV